ncbi:ferrochelatase [Propionibacteriaceae bacterium Y1700]|uniref:ferrochelatase n=1 Tax=Microlunatus sp. Y1700 TaxID=3418487 RepID=UPI003DA74A32
MAEPATDLSPYDAVVLVSFGGPEGPEEVLPFLQQVTRGRNIPTERLREVGQHYDARGGISPINDECRALLAALRTELDSRGVATPVLWGNRNSRPFLSDTMAEADAAGYRRLLAVTTSAYESYSSCRQYREDLARTVRPGLVVDRVRQYATHPGFVEANIAQVLAAMEEVGPRPRLVFVTHSIPTAMSESSGPAPRSSTGSYLDTHQLVAAAITRAVDEVTGEEHQYDLVFCSRSGPPQQPWLEPDVNDHLDQLAAQGVTDVVLAPIGFTSDHMEVVHDLDTEAAETIRRLGLRCARASTARTHPAFVGALVDLALERAALARGTQVRQPVIDGAAVSNISCPGDCCVNLRHPDTPTLAGS